MACESFLLRAIFISGCTVHMKKIELKRSEEMLLALLRSALHQHEVEIGYFLQATEEDWVRCYRLAVRQGVSALAWEGIERLPVAYTPPLDVKVSWALLEKKQLATYRKHVRVVNELTQFFAQHGIATVVLKGVGLSRLYPVPAHRDGGDIDIYTYSADQSRMTDEEANRLANELMEKQGLFMDNSIYTKHSKFCYLGMTVENHWMFLHEAECQMIVQTEQWLQQHFETTQVELMDGACRIEVPSVAFDQVFVALHAAQHYGMGLCLKHLCDWVILLQKGGGELPSEPDDIYFKRAITTLTLLCNRYLGLKIPVEGDGKLADEMIREILCPRYFQKIPADGSLKAYWLQLKNRVYIFRLKHRLLGVSFWGKLRGLLVRRDIQ